MFAQITQNIFLSKIYIYIFINLIITANFEICLAEVSGAPQKISG